MMVLTTAALPGTAHTMTGTTRTGTTLTTTALPGTPNTDSTWQTKDGDDWNAKDKDGDDWDTDSTWQSKGKRRNQSSLGARVKRRESRMPKIQKYHMDQAEKLNEVNGHKYIYFLGGEIYNM